MAKNLIFYYFAVFFGVIYGKRMFLRKFEMCDPNSKYQITFAGSFRVQNDVQYANMSSTLQVPFGRDQWLNISFEFSNDGVEFTPLFKFSRRNLCDFFVKDLGTIWFEIQKQIGVPVRSCPIPVGKYNVKEYKLALTKMNFPLPNGFIRSFLNVLWTKTNEIVSCLVTVLEVTN